MNTKIASSLILLALSWVTACGDDGGAPPEDPMEPTELPSGATCPESSTLTYDTFARAFFEDHCTRCHSADLGPLERGAAPVGVNFDSLDAIRSVGAEEIDEHAVKGGSDAEMPPGDPLPSEGERADLGEWLACGMQ